MADRLSIPEFKMQQQVLRYEYVLGALSDIGDELCRVTSFGSQLKSLLHLLLGTLGVRKGGIFLYDANTRRVSMRCSWKLSHKALEYDVPIDVVRALEEESAEITFKASEFAYLPGLIAAFEADAIDCVSVLKVRGKLIGFIVVGKKLKEAELNEKEVSFLKTLSRNISVAINNFLLLSDLRETNLRLDEKIREVSILYQASQMISSELQIQALLDLAMNAISEITEIERGSAWIYDEEHDWLDLKSHSGDACELPEHIALKNSRVLAFAHEKKIPFEIINGTSEAIPSLEKSDKNIFGSSFVIVPILSQGEFLGMVHLCACAASSGFTERDVRLIKVFATQLGVAVKNAQLYEQAITDGMTKLYLHRYFKQRLQDELKRATRFKRRVALIMSDIDHFKLFNDNFGHQTGDEVLKHVASIMRRAVRTHDLPARYGGEEFAIILPETDIIGAVAVAERIRRTIETDCLEIGDDIHRVTASFGVAVFPDCASDIEGLIKASDVALYWSKEHGRNQVTAAPRLPEAKTED